MPRFAVLDECWGHPDSERAFVARTVAGALACHGAVDVVTPGPPSPPQPDGAFRLISVGNPSAAGASWPVVADGALPPERYDGVLVVGGAPAYPAELAGRLTTGLVATLYVGGANSPTGDSDPMSSPVLRVDGGHRDPAHHDVGFFVSVNPTARTAPLGGIGCTDYILVLGGHAPAPATPAHDPARLPAAARWLIARFPRRFVLTVVDGGVTVWRDRSPHGWFGVGTRMDLWRLMAFARVTVDPLPGPVVARECIESLMFGTPVVVPGVGAALSHAAAGGATYRHVAALLDEVDGVSDPVRRAALASSGQAYATDRYGSPRHLVDAIGAVFGLPA